MKNLLQSGVSVLTLIMALSAPETQASYSDEEDSPKGHYSVGKEDEWDNQSIVSRAFSDRRGPDASKQKPLKDEELSYGPEDEWEVGSEYTAHSEARSKESQKLTDIKELRRYMNKGNIEITPSTHEALLKYSEFYASSFHAFDKGVVIKGWKTSLGFDPLLDILQSFSNLKTFKLRIEWDKEADVTELLTRTLQFYENLTDLDIAGCRLTDQAIKEMVEAIQNPASLKSLDVSNNTLTPKTIQAIKTHFINLASLKSDINLTEDKELKSGPVSTLSITTINDKGTEERAKLKSSVNAPVQVQPTRKLTNDDIHEALKKVKAETLNWDDFAAFINSDPTLTTVYLEGNSIGDEGATVMAEALKQNMTITTVYLWANSIGPMGATAMAKALKQNKTINTIDLRYNNIGAEGATAMAEALKQNKTINTVDLRYNSIGAAGTTVMAEALKQNMTITTVYLEGNSIGDEGAKAMAEALKQNKTIVMVDLGYNSISAAGATAMAEALEQNKTINMVYLWGNSIDDAGKKTLEDLKRSRPSLQLYY